MAAHDLPSCLLEIGIFASHLIFLLRSRKIRREASAEGKSFDEIMIEHESQGLPFKFAERKSRKVPVGKERSMQAVGIEGVESSAAQKETQEESLVPPSPPLAGQETLDS